VYRPLFAKRVVQTLKRYLTEQTVELVRRITLMKSFQEGEKVQQGELNKPSYLTRDI
jgi:hypothetical protein